MVRKSGARSSSLFLMELILAILFFSVASGVCVQFFVRSHLLSRDSEALNHAVNECAGIAEAVCTTDGAAEAAALLRELYPKADQSEAGSELVIYYNDTFEPCTEESAAWRLTVSLTEEAQMLDAAMQMTSFMPAGDPGSAGSDNAAGGSRTIYDLTVQHHIAGRTGH